MDLQAAADPSATLPIPPLASDSESDPDAPNVIPGTRASDPGPRTTEYDDEEHRIVQSLGDKACPACIQWPKRQCHECGCHVCGGKDEEHRTLVCDGCGDYYHCNCLEPPLNELPDGEWKCPVCVRKMSKGKERAHDPTKKEVTVLPAKKPAKAKKADESKQKVCSVVGPHHFGPIPGVEVGQAYKFRKGASEAGVHRPPMAGISGTPKIGSQSIVLSGGYKDDVDEGDSFIYSGAGGRETSETGGRIGNVQSSDQTLDKTNAALAITMFPDLTDPEKLDREGAVSADWTRSKEVRVIRSEKMKSDYAPKEGFRYDGIYKLARYWPEKGQDGYTIYKYEFKRDDPIPAPWTEEGKARIAELGLRMVFPEDWDPITKKTKRKREDDEAVHKKKRVSSYKPPEELQSLMELDVRNRATWEAVLARSTDINEFIEELHREFKCPVCNGAFNNPVILRCGHSACQDCLQQSFEKNGIKCPACWATPIEGEGGDDELQDAWNKNPPPVNCEFIGVMKYLSHTYDGSDPAY